MYIIFQNTAKWYEVTDLTYLLSPNSSFNKAGLTVSSGLMKIFDELKNEAKKSSNRDVRRNLVFQRLKDKFNVLLPPPKSDVRHNAWESWIWSRVNNIIDFFFCVNICFRKTKKNYNGRSAIRTKNFMTIIWICWMPRKNSRYFNVGTSWNSSTTLYTR